MANKTIGDLTSATALTGAEYIEIEQSGTSKKAPLSLVFTGLYAKISDTKTSGTDGGTATSGSWETRTLQTEDSDVNSIVSISSNQFTLQAGTYRIHARVPAYTVDWFRAKLYNVTDAADVLFSDNTSSAANATVHAVITGKFTIAGAKAFEIRQRVWTTNATVGRGIASGFAAEIYTTVELWKEA